MFTDRLREMRYISPSGQEFVLQFDSLERTGGKKAPVSEFPTQNQGAVQDLGEITPTFPVTCYISGPDYDLEADRFSDALSESGTGNLYHPRWGNLQVLPTTRSQSEQFVDGVGRALFTITFIRVSEEQFQYPTAAVDPNAKTQAAVDEAATAVTEGVPEEIDDTKTLSGLKESITGTLDVVTGAFDTISGIGDDIRESINQVVNDITDEIDDLVQAPADLMTSMLSLYRTPARVITDVREKVRGYKAMYTNLATGFVTTTAKYGELFGLVQSANMASIALSSAEATTAGTTPTRRQAGEVVGDLSDLYDSIRGTIEDMEEAGDYSTGYDMLLKTAIAVSAALTGLIDSALNLPAEKTKVLDGDITPIELAYQIDGDIDRLDMLMKYNDLVGDEIMVIPRGREVRWYE